MLSRSGTAWKEAEVSTALVNVVPWKTSGIYNGGKLWKTEHLPKMQSGTSRFFPRLFQGNGEEVGGKKESERGKYPKKISSTC